MKNLRRLITTISLILVSCHLVSCSGDQQAATPAESATETTEKQSQATLPNGLILTERPTGELKTITALKETAKPGDEVLIEAYIGGRLKPFVAGRAIMTVVDVGLNNACNSDDDHCKTPWDYCCAREQLAESMATVQVLDSNQKALAASLESAQLPAGGRIVIAGTVSQTPSGEALVINATGIYPAK